MEALLSVDRLSRELIRAVRGRQSQRAFSRALGFTSNVAYTWETGRRFPEASVFLRAAERRSADFQRAFARILSLDSEAESSRAAVAAKGPKAAPAKGNPSSENALPKPGLPARLGTPRAVQTLVTRLAGTTPVGELAAQLGVDRTTVARWLRGETEPRLPELLRLVDVGTQRLLAFVELIADPGELASTRAAHRDLLLQQKLAYELPWSHALLRALELAVYRDAPEHDAELLARSVGMPVELVVNTLEVLEKAGQIRREAHHFVNARVMAVDTRSDPERNRALKQHWARVGLERLTARDTAQEALFSFNLFAVNEAAFQRIRALHLDYYDRVRAIVDEEPGTDHVVLLNLQLVPLERREQPS